MCLSLQHISFWQDTQRLSTERVRQADTKHELVTKYQRNRWRYVKVRADLCHACNIDMTRKVFRVHLRASGMQQNDQTVHLELTVLPYH